jgi:hypothetical protein
MITGGLCEQHHGVFQSTRLTFLSDRLRRQDESQGETVGSYLSPHKPSSPPPPRITSAGLQSARRHDQAQGRQCRPARKP